MAFSLCISTSVSSCPRLLRTTSHWIRAHLNPVWRRCNLIPSAKTPFPNKMAVTGPRIRTWAYLLGHTVQHTTVSFPLRGSLHPSRKRVFLLQLCSPRWCLPLPHFLRGSEESRNPPATSTWSQPDLPRRSFGGKCLLLVTCYWASKESRRPG